MRPGASPITRAAAMDSRTRATSSARAAPTCSSTPTSTPHG